MEPPEIRKRLRRLLVLTFGIGLLFPSAPGLHAQSPELRQILDRLERLERENHALAEEVRQLRAELKTSVQKQPPAAPAATAESSPPTAGEQPPDIYLPERLAVQERRVEEQAQTKVEASQRFPIQLTGMALFNGFLNSRGVTTKDKRNLDPVTAGGASSGATVRQSVFGLTFRGPETILGGKVHGSFFVDFFDGYYDVFTTPGGSYSSEWPMPRLRTAEVTIDWKSRSFTFGHLKPLIAPREPDSLAQVGVPALADAGNLWLWLPQARFEQRVSLAENTSLTGQLAVVQTNERWATVSANNGVSLEAARPAIEGRLQLAHSGGQARRFEIAPGFHASTTHVAGTSVPSRLFSFDGMARPWRKLELSGTMYQGRNVANIGAMWQGFTVFGYRNASPVHSRGGWAQLALFPTSRFTLHFYGGQQSDRKKDLPFGGIASNRSYAANAMYRLAPNVLLSLESGQSRMTFVRGGHKIRNYYDLALAYLF